MPQHSQPGHITVGQSKSEKRVALVLSGGGAKAAYEAGVIEGLSEMGIQANVVIGTSAGALNALVYALGGGNRLNALWNRITNKDVYTPHWWWALLLLIVIVFLLTVFDTRFGIIDDKIIIGLIGGRSASAEEVNTFGLILSAYILVLVVVRKVLHWMNYKHPQIADWLDRKLEFLKSVYDNTPLLTTIWTELMDMLGLQSRLKVVFLKRGIFKVLWGTFTLLRRLIRIIASVMIIFGALMEQFIGASMIIVLIVYDGGFRWFMRKQLLKLSQRCVKHISDGFSATQTALKEIIVTACDLDARTDTTFFLLKGQHQMEYCRTQARRQQRYEIQMGNSALVVGGYNYVNLRFSPETFLPSVIASTSIPLIFPPQRIGLPHQSAWIGVVHRFVDGGIGNNTPITAAVDSGATHIIVVEVNPRDIDFAISPLCTPLDVGVRSVSTMLTASVDEEFQRYNDLRNCHTQGGQPYPDLVVIRPKKELTINSLDFGADRIQDAIKQGRFDATNNEKLRRMFDLPTQFGTTVAI